MPTYDFIVSLSAKEKKQRLRDFPKSFKLTGGNFGGLSMWPRDEFDIGPAHGVRCGLYGHPRKTCLTSENFVSCHNCDRRGVTVRFCPRCKDAFAAREREEAERDRHSAPRRPATDRHRSRPYDDDSRSRSSDRRERR